MENFIRDGVDLKAISSRTINGDAHFFEDATTPAKVRELLDSQKEADKLKGMKLLLAMLSKGKDVPEFFPDVVKNVVVKSIEVKKMVYTYLMHYADFDSTCRELALLSINSFQKDFALDNPLIRGIALRVMTSIRVLDILQIQLLAVRKCASDRSPYVRKCAANAIPKIFALDKGQLENLKDIIDKLLNDTSTMVLGSTVAAFNEVCPTSYELLHKNYKKLCHLLADMDEWTQVSVLEVMTRYIRNQFCDPTPGAAKAAKLQAKQRSASAVKGQTSRVVRRRVVKKAFYSDEEDESGEEEIEVTQNSRGTAQLPIDDDNFDDRLDEDHRLILKSSLPLLKSRNSGVVLGVCSLHYYGGGMNSSTMQLIAKALVRILRTSREVQYVVLNCIKTMAQERPEMFRPFLSEFFIKASDPIFNRKLKLDILTCISTAENTHAILLELQIYIKDSNQDFVCGAVRCVGRITDAEPKVLDACIQGIMNLLLCTKSVIVASECVTVLRQMIQQNSLSPVSNRVMHQLVKLLITDMEDPIARSSVVWLVAEFHSALHKIAPDVLRILAKGFALEHTATKMQTLNLAVKQSLRLPDDEKVQALATYVLEMARYDLDTDLRDRARFLTALLGLAPAAEDGSEVAVDENALAELAEHAHAILLAPKLPPVTLLRSMDIDGVPAYSVGSMSSIVGHYCIGYEKLPPWSKVYADSSVRENFKLDGLEVDKLISSGFSRSLETVKEKSVDDLQIFYGDKRREIVSSSSESNSAVESVSSEEESDSSESESDSGSAVTSDSSDSEVSKLPASVHSKSSQGSKPINTSSSKNLVGVLSHETTTSQPDKKSGVVMRGGIRRVAKRTNNPSSSSDTTNQASSVISNNLLGFDQLQLGGNNEGKDLTSLLETEPHVSNQQKTAVDSLDVLFIESNKSVLSANQTSLQSSKISSMSFLDEVQDNAVVSKRDAILHSKVGPTEAFSATSSTIGDFAGLTMAPIATSIQKSNTVTVPEILSEPKILLKSELGGGLYVQMQFYYGGTTTHNKSGLWRAVLRIENVKEQPIRRVKIIFPMSVRRTNTPIDIAAIGPKEDISLPIELMLTGNTGKHLKVDVRSDKGSFSGSMDIEEYELMQPLPQTLSEYYAGRQRLQGGFSEISKKYNLEDIRIGGDRKEIAGKIRRNFNIYPVQEILREDASGEDAHLLYSGIIRKQGEDVKVYLTVALEMANLSVVFNCGDALMCTSLNEAFKKLITK